MIGLITLCIALPTGTFAFIWSQVRPGRPERPVDTTPYGGYKADTIQSYGVGSRK